ncbi:MAG TPA: alpha/beta hydrolase fold domain-containing protein [Verrucomicrobiae bacterium]|nr:alpha/beta hydrolase fold domain-containing protein [Verrucomicrobiae bacterium]
MLRDRIDPELQAFNDAVSADWRKHPPLETLTPPEARAVAEQVRARWTKGGPGMASTHEHLVQTEKGQIRVRIYVPRERNTPAPALIYSHGGGFTLFSIDTHDRLMREYAAAGGFTVVGVDYPLAPEAKFPIALDLVTERVRTLHRDGARFGIDGERLALGGDSAGGNFAVSACLRLRDRGELPIVKALLSNYGGFAVGCSDEAEAEFGGPNAVLARDESYYFFGNYLNHPDEARDPYACPINADLRGLPPIFLAIAECDIVAEHNVAMAQRFRDAGVDAASKIYRGATHSFLEAMSVSALAREAIGDGARFIAHRLNVA